MKDLEEELRQQEIDEEFRELEAEEYHRQQEIDEEFRELEAEEYHRQQEAEEKFARESGVEVEIKANTPGLGDITMKV